MKRLFDLTLSIVALLLVSPLLLLVAIAVRIKLGSPVLFSQMRAGYEGKPFRIYKFRSMLDTRDAEGKLLASKYRLTSFGKFLRSTSLDELPGLWNVIIGEMSLVGPRPLLLEYLPLYSAEQARRHDVKPGITGWAQVNGRNELSWEEKFELDVWYVDNRTLWLDFKILISTVLIAARRVGISDKSGAINKRFEGSPPSNQNTKI